MHRCCEDQCAGILNALQAFPFAAGDDVIAAKLDPLKVVAARKLEMEHAQKKPAWEKIPRHVADKSGWGIIKSRWIDINKGDDDNPSYTSRMAGEVFNDRVLDGVVRCNPALGITSSATQLGGNRNR